MTTFDSDRAMTMLGVSGRLTHRTTKPDHSRPGLWFKQRWISEFRKTDYGKGCEIRTEVRFDDECNNGHNTFAITATIIDTTQSRRHLREVAGGCLHEEIAKSFPELAPLIKWHLTSSDGPMHYIANTIYHAGNRDHNGLLLGEKRQIISGRTKKPCWQLEVVNSEGIGLSGTETGLKYAADETVPLFILEKSCEGDAPPLATPVLKWVPWCRVGEGKKRELDHARSSAVWPDATDEQLSVEPAELRKVLEDRHPALMAEFRAAMDSTGFVWAPELMPA